MHRPDATREAAVRVRSTARRPAATARTGRAPRSTSQARPVEVADQPAPPPRLVATIGMHASASTWVFNVVRELLIAAVGDAQVLTFYADELGQMPDEAARAGRHLVIKSHHGSEALDTWLAAAPARIILSMRDPRDACISMSQRFKSPLNHTVRWIANDCNRLLRLAPQGHLLLRYEDRFFDDRTAAERLASALGLRPAPDMIEAIFARYRTEAVRSFAQQVKHLPPARLTPVASFMMDRVTQILEPHIGDGRIGKWRDLPAPLPADLTRVFGPFLDRFGYRREA
jgi:Sulfotransferase domain